MVTGDEVLTFEGAGVVGESVGSAEKVFIAVGAGDVMEVSVG